MDLLTLNLHRRLSWSRAGRLASAAEALEAALAAPEGCELAFSWDWDDAIVASDDGPRLREPLPAPAWIAASGLPGQAAAAEAGAESLEPGRYAFVQARPSAADGQAAAAELSGLVEWFAREAWWQRVEATGPLVVRLVREDGKTAMQIIRRLA